MAEYDPNVDVYTEVVEADISESFTFIQDVKLQEKTATQNGVVTPDAGKDGLSKVTVAVPNTYTESDEGKVVSNSALVGQTSTTKNANGTYDTTLNDEVVVNVPNSYTAADEGKVVQSGALVAQTSQSITENGTYDTTTKNSVSVSVSGGGGIQSGTTAPTSDVGSDGDYYKQIFPLASGMNFVEYLESNGTQYIDTGVVATGDIDIFLQIEDLGNQTVFGVRTGSWSSMTNAIYVTGSSGGKISILKTTSSASGSSYEKTAPSGFFSLSTRTLKESNDYYTALPMMNGSATGSKLNQANFASNGSMIMFTGRLNGSIGAGQKARIARAVIFNKYVPIKDYLPCLDGNGVACMWDNIAQEYVYNDGTGDFLYGSTVTPDALEPVLWVKESGSWRVVGS